MRTTQGALQAAAAAGALTAEELEAAKKVVTSEEVKPGVKDEDTPEVKDETPAEGEGTPEVSEESTDEGTPEVSAMDLMKTQLAEANDALVGLKVELKESQGATTKLRASVDPLKAVVASAANNMSIALGHSANDKLAEASAEDILAAHTSVSEQFAEEFKVGGVGAPASEVEDDKQKPELSSMEKARLKSAKVVPMTR